MGEFCLGQSVRKLPESDTNPVKKTNETWIQSSLLDRLDSSLDGNRDLFLILKQEPWYN